MKFLEREREAVARLAEYQPRRRRTLEVPKNDDRGKGLTHHGTGTGQGQKQFYQCAFHKRDTVKHKTSDCKEFQKLPISGGVASLNSSNKWMPALSALEITHSRSVLAKNHVHCLEVRSTTFSCASQGKRKKVQTLPVRIRLYQHLERKKIDKLTIVLMLNQQVMLQEELALLSIPSSRQRCVRVGRMLPYSVMVAQTHPT